jgi:hypothetical protein
VSIRCLDALFRPGSVTVIGASDRPHSAGGVLIRNLLRGGSTGRVMLRDGWSVLLRPIRPEDEPAHPELFQRMTPEDIYYRFFHVFQQLPRSDVVELRPSL